MNIKFFGLGKKIKEKEICEKKFVRDTLLFYSLHPMREIRVENKTHEIDKIILQVYHYFIDFINNHYFFVNDKFHLFY